MRSIAAVSILPILGAVGAGCAPSSARPTAPEGVRAGPSIAGGEAVVRAGPAEDTHLLTGELRAILSEELITPRAEFWELQIKWLAEDGTDLRAGDRAIEFDNTPIVQTIEEKKLRLIEAGIALETRRASIGAEEEEKQLVLERAEIAEEKARAEASVPAELVERRLWQEKQAAQRAADAGLTKARLDLRAFEIASRADLEVLRIARDKAAREVAAAERGLDALAIQAPRDGIFILSDYWREERKFQIGDTVWPGQTVATIPDLGAMEVVGYLPEVDDGRIASGMEARCVLDTYPDRSFRGTVEEVAAIASDATQRGRSGFKVRVALERSDPSLMRPGMSVRVEVIRRKWDHALLLTRAGVRDASGEPHAIREAGERVDLRLAACTPTDCIIESGLVEGDVVALP